MSMRELHKRLLFNRAKSSDEGRQAIGDFLGGVRDSIGDRLSSFRDRMSNPNVGRQLYGSSPLQQAIAQRDAGILTDAGAELLRGMELNPSEMDRQAQLMSEGISGDYGIDRKANPYYSDATTNMVQGGPPEMIGNSPVTMSTSVANNDMQGVDQRLMLDRFMREPDKLNAEGIKSMQTMLNSLGFRDSNDNMLDVDGKIGNLTRSAMESYYSSMKPLPESKSASVPQYDGTMNAGLFNIPVD